MITEDYVSFETAKLLKEKGFNYPCRVVYSPKGIVKHYLKEEVYAHHLKGHKKLCPTLQMAMKWLREIHNVVIVVTSSMFWGRYNVSIYKKGNDYPYGFDGGDLVPSYEQACEAAIKYCLKNLI